MDAGIARIIDANLNRGREALRVMEEHARFVLDDAVLTGLLKQLRHDLADVVTTRRLGSAIVMRDTRGDVGTAIRGAGEYVRASAADVVVAAGKRLGEALRVLEEYVKPYDQGAAGELEALRYRGYTVEQRLCLLVESRRRLEYVHLYVLVTESLCRMDWRKTVKAAVAGGADCLQLREKELSDAALLRRAIEFCALCRECRTLCMINDRADIAAACGADGVHLGQEDISVAAARKVLGTGAIVGVSTHSVEQARDAAAQCPDYIALGPMFATELKPEYGVAGVGVLREVRAATGLPLVGIGGITSHNAADVISAGANTVAVCSAVIASDDPADAAERIRSQFV